MPTPTTSGDSSAAANESSTDLDGLFPLIVATAQRLTSKYPKRHGAFERLGQLTEETGEVAEQINIWAGTGLKRQKHGEFNPQHLATEVCDVIRVAVGIALEFDIVDLVGHEIRAQYARTLQAPGTK